MGAPSKEELRNRVIRIIAATRFPFVDQKDWGPDYVTITNDDARGSGASLVPWATSTPA
jgi:hypothetical protein